MVNEYVVKCWKCMAEYNALESPFCNHPSPSKICPFCLNCFCQASEEYQADFWDNSPRQLLEEKLIIENRTSLMLGEMLIRAGKITMDQLKEAIEKQKIIRKHLGEIIVMMDLLTPEELELYLIDQKQIEEIDLKNIKINADLIERIGIDFCSLHRVIPLEMMRVNDRKALRLAITPKLDLNRIKTNERIREFTVIPYIAKSEEIDRVLRTLNGEVDEEDVLVLNDESDDGSG